jgi:hypothetical protein
VFIGRSLATSVSSGSIPVIELPCHNNFIVTPKVYITTEDFCKRCRDFSHGTNLLILDGHRTHLDPSVLNETIKINFSYFAFLIIETIQPLAKHFFVL